MPIIYGLTSYAGVKYSMVSQSKDISLHCDGIQKLYTIVAIIKPWFIGFVTHAMLFFILQVHNQPDY
jgi:hypothetical protein